MKYAIIPQTELHAARICFGTATIGGAISEAESFTLMDTYFDHGGNFIDTASVYSDWTGGEKSISEKTIGKWMKDRGNRDRIVLATKGGHPPVDNPLVKRLTREDITLDLEKSLVHLETDVIDLYWLHRDDPSQPVEEIIDLLHEFVQAGSIRFYACSNWTVDRIESARQYAAATGKQPFVANQMLWSLAELNAGSIGDPTIVPMDGQTMDYHITTGLAAIPFTSQAQGFFSGRFRAEDRSRPDIVKKFYNDTNFARLSRVEELAKQLGRSGTEVALAYLMSQPFATFPIVGCRTQQQLAESISANDLQLDADDVRYLRDGE